jgi:PAS domain S-box-containing protein
MNQFQKKIKRRFIVQIIAPMFLSLCVILGGYFFTLSVLKTIITKEHKELTKEMVFNLCNMLSELDQQVHDGKITINQAQNSAILNVKVLQYGKDHSNYFWIQDTVGNFIYHPLIISRPGNTNEIYNPARNIALKIAGLLKTSDNLFISYTWQSNKHSIAEEKNAFAKSFTPWGWIICTGFKPSDINDSIQIISKTVLRLLFVILGGVILILLIVLYLNHINLARVLQQEIKLHKSEVRFKSFIQQIDDGLMIYEDKLPVFINQQISDIFNLPISTIQNSNLWNLAADGEHERVKLIMSNWDRVSLLTFNTWIKTPKGIKKYIKATLSSDTSYKYVVINDITQQKTASTTIDVLSANIAQSPNAIITTDLTGAIEYVNPEFEKTSGYSFDEVYGQTPRILKSGKMSPLVYNDMWKTISSGHIWKGETLNKRKDGRLYWESTIIFPIKNQNNEIIKYSSIKTDITHLKKMEEELLAAKEKAEENERIKSAFLNNISHEVRTPLNAITGFSRVLKDGRTNTEDELLYLQIIERNSQILLKLFNDIIDYSEIESKSIKWHRTNVYLKKLLLKLVSKYNSKVATNNKTIEIQIEDDGNLQSLVLFTDQKRLMQIFDHLISNAVKYTQQGTINISYKIDPNYITFRISDSGVGIPDNEKNNIFESFVHGNHLFIGSHHGVGLGLNVVKILVEKMGGTLSFKSKEGVGSEFTFTIPTIDAKGYQLEGQLVDVFPSLNKKITILIAEDNDESFNYMQILLANRQTVIRAKTGIEATSLIETSEKLPDVILMDILMPEMNGSIAGRIIREKYPQIPIIGIHSSDEKFSPSEQICFDAILQKPISPTGLIEQLKRLLN